MKMKSQSKMKSQVNKLKMMKVLRIKPRFKLKRLRQKLRPKLKKKRPKLKKLQQKLLRKQPIRIHLK